MTQIGYAFSPNGGCQDHVVATIQAAQAQAHIVSYSFTNTAIEQAILAVSKRVPDTKVVFDRKQTFGVQGRMHDELEAAGVQIQLYSPTGGIMHDKYSVIDGHIVENGSFNYTEAGEHRNWENVQVNDDPNLGAAYEGNFQKLWALAQPEASLDERIDVRLHRTLMYANAMVTL